MSHASHAAHVATLIDDLSDVSLAQLADLREYAQALQLEEGTVHLERSIRDREARRVELFSLLQQAAFGPPLE
ncbi:hypothetical protein ACPOL_7169 (plasmid) [Acidisarcina polymorpha]|uniref:Uncharacterized protein n=1 Tax=Acidisarcina polymorpha TaxID=2211140 RepID=A0A2Z5GB79_9BACT|nr:hypothetical protein [Acidisarcina polymorpha]AXC16361.1 hypothetical protein ACPOL_7169 [Acidisarcina polymorpha]